MDNVTNASITNSSLVVDIGRPPLKFPIWATVVVITFIIIFCMIQYILYGVPGTVRPLVQRYRLNRPPPPPSPSPSVSVV